MSELFFQSGKPRIAMISTHGYVASIPPLGAADTGGQVVYVLELSKKLAQLGYEVDIWTRRFDGQEEIDSLNANVRVIRMPCGGSEFIPKEYLHRSLPEWGENALRFIAKHKLRYQFINSHYWDAGIAGQHLSDVLGVPHLHTPHSLGLWKRRQMETDFPENKDKFDKEFNFREREHHERLLYTSAELVIATTPLQLDMLIQDYEVPMAKIHMVPPGYDDSRFYPISEASRQGVRQRLGYEGSAILALGRLATNKGYDLLIRAFDLVAQRVPDARLYLAVGGTKLDPKESALLAELKSLAVELGLKERVIFSGFIPDEELADHYRAADIFVLSSRYEPFGMTAIEAMACGTPTVVTTHGGLFRVVTFGRHALFGDPFDREDLGMMILKPLRHPRLKGRMSRMGAHKARSLFTWTGIAQQLIGLAEARVLPDFKLKDEEWDEPWNDGD
ncbi:MAG: glycosyltransferase family 1 protein [Blastochloris sp.]|nr:glycosyltransferase family 1 protein [Blastochloris sp.]